MSDARRDAEILERFVAVYCRGRHGGAEGALCPACRELLAYALERRGRCLMDPKPACRACPVHCYEPPQRQRIREVMRYSGMYFARRGRVDWLVRYFRPRWLFRRRASG